MFTFALDASFKGLGRQLPRARALINAFSVNSADGDEFAASRLAAAGVRRWAVTSRDLKAIPVWDPAAGILFAGDVRLYNRPELVAELGAEVSVSLDCSDLELARLAFARWGHASPQHLVGDFAFAAWNENERSLFVARDHLGVRPVYFRRTTDGVSVASDLQQFLPLVSDRLEQVNPQMVLDWFQGCVRDLRRTFLRGVCRIRPGHFIVADADGVAETRYWWPSPKTREGLSYEENCELLLAAFTRAVADRLESDRPVVAHSSGGFDSSTIVMVANDVYQRDPMRPPLVLASGVAHGYPSDESRYMDAVDARVSFEGVRWDVVSETPHEFPGISRSAPVLRTGLGGGAPRDLEIAQSRGARVLLSGMLGDDLLHAMGVLRDFVRHHRWGNVLAGIPRRGLVPALRTLFDVGLGLLSPSALETLRGWAGGGSIMPSDWMGPALIALFPIARSRRPDPETFTWPTHLASSLWTRISGPHTAAVIDSMVQYGLEVGIEVRMPYVDVRLVEEVFRFPWHQRTPHGDYRRTGMDSIGRLLPPEFRTRPAQPSWGAVREANVRAAIPGLAPFIEDGRWRSAPFVDRGMARAALRRSFAAGDPASAAGRYRAYEFGVFEAWLRAILEYNPGGEVH